MGTFLFLSLLLGGFERYCTLGLSEIQMEH